MSLEEQVRRGDEARRLLEHPLLVEAFDLIEKQVTQEWMNSPARDADGREKLWLTLKCLYRVRQQIDAVAETGKLAKASLAQKAADLAQRIGRRR